jgi:NDP-sugar pyrophosphorylase family protein
MSNIQAVILAGGQGSRLRPYTTVIPKPLMPLGDVPILEIVLRQLKHAGFRRIAISTGYLAGLIEAYVGDGRKWGITVSYVHENQPLGTAGSLKQVKGLDDSFLVINGDVLTDLNFSNLMKAHKQGRAHATITVKERVVKTDFGVVEIGRDNRMVDFHEKPEHKSHVSIGVNVLRKAALTCIKRNEYLGMPDLLLRVKAAGESVYCFKTKAFWLDLGRPEDLDFAQEYWAKYQHKFLKR